MIFRVLLAFVGLVLILIGGIGMTQEAETAPTPIDLAAFEKGGAMPTKRWVEINEGILLWPLKVELVVHTEDSKGKKVTEGTVNTVFVPMVSKEFADAYLAGPANKDFPLDKIRVFVRYSPTGFQHLVLTPKGEPDIRTKLSGTSYPLDKDEKLVREGLFPPGVKVDRTKVLIINNAQDSPSKGVLICVGVGFILIGVALCLPLAFRIFGKKKDTAR